MCLLRRGNGNHVLVFGLFSLNMQFFLNSNYMKARFALRVAVTTSTELTLQLQLNTVESAVCCFVSYTAIRYTLSNAPEV